MEWSALLIGKVKARGVGEMIANAGGCNGASVVTSSAAENIVIVIDESYPIHLFD